jgi:hypothetical protein
MPPDVTKSVKVTFAQSLPMGTRGTFTHEKELFIAYPAKKQSEIFAINTRLVGILAAVKEDMTQWLNDHPDDAMRIVGIMTRITRVDALVDEISREIARTATS